MQFEERLKYLRQCKGVSEKDLAEELETTETTIRLYEKGKLDVTLDMLEKLADYFDVSPQLLLGTVFSGQSPEEAVQSYRIVQEMVETRHQEKSRKPVSGSAVPQVQSDLPRKDLFETPDLYASASFKALRAGMVAVYQRIAGQGPSDCDYQIEGYWPVNTAITAMYGNDLNNYFYLRIQGDRMQPTLSEGEVALVRRQSAIQNNEVAVIINYPGEAWVARVTQSPDKLILFFDNKNYQAQLWEPGQCQVLGKVLWKTTTSAG